MKFLSANFRISPNCPKKITGKALFRKILFSLAILFLHAISHDNTIKATDEKKISLQLIQHHYHSENESSWLCTIAPSPVFNKQEGSISIPLPPGYKLAQNLKPSTKGRIILKDSTIFDDIWFISWLLPGNNEDISNPSDYQAINLECSIDEHDAESFCQTEYCLPSLDCGCTTEEDNSITLNMPLETSFEEEDFFPSIKIAADSQEGFILSWDFELPKNAHILGINIHLPTKIANKITDCQQYQEGIAPIGIFSSSPEMPFSKTFALSANGNLLPSKGKIKIISGQGEEEIIIPDAFKISLGGYSHALIPQTIKGFFDINPVKIDTFALDIPIPQKLLNK